MKTAARRRLSPIARVLPGLLLSMSFAAPARAQTPATMAEDTFQTINVGVSQAVVLKVQGGVDRIATGDARVADCKPLGMKGTNEVLITGVAEGKTTLLVWRMRGDRFAYTIFVRRQTPEEVAGEAKALLGEMEGVSIRIVGENVYLEGETLTTEDADRVRAVVKIYPRIQSFVRPSINALKAQAKNLNRAFADNGLKNVMLNVVGGSTFLEGTVESDEDMKKAEMIVKAMGSQVENLLSVGIKRMVMVEVQVVEIRRKDNQGFGITYPTNISGNLSLNSRFGQNDADATAKGLVNGQGINNSQTTFDWSLGHNAQLSASSDFAMRMRFDSGYGRLLSQPRLVCASGSKAHFNVGGQVPMVVAMMNTVSVTYKEYGVIVDLKPTADRQNNISTDIDVTISEPDASQTVRAGTIEVPGFRSRNVHTDVTVKHGETIVLSGLFNYDQQKNISKVPLLGHIPVLGELFKSRQFQEAKNEIAIFITPRVVNPDSDRVRETIDKIKERYKDADDAVGFSIWD